LLYKLAEEKSTFRRSAPLKQHAVKFERSKFENAKFECEKSANSISDFEKTESTK
jgi:hypothetical protein